MSKKENVDYELIPVQVYGNDQGWDVRFLTGDFTETVIRYGNVAVDGKADVLTFNFIVVESPEADLDADTNEVLQKEAADILIDIIERSIEDKSIVLKNKGDSIIE